MLTLKHIGAAFIASAIATVLVIDTGCSSWRCGGGGGMRAGGGFGGGGMRAAFCGGSAFACRWHHRGGALAETVSRMPGLSRESPSNRKPARLWPPGRPDAVYLAGRQQADWGLPGDRQQAGGAGAADGARQLPGYGWVQPP